MATDRTSFRSIIDAWPSKGALAADLNVTAGAVSNMLARNSIPVRHWSKLIDAAGRRGIEGVSADALARCSSHEIAA